MHMIGHDAPCQQAIADGIELVQGFLHDRGHGRMTQRAAAHAGIQPAFHLFAPFALLYRRIKLASGQLDGKSVKFVLGQGVGKPEGNSLGDLCGVEMRQIATGIPAGRAGHGAIRGGGEW